MGGPSLLTERRPRTSHAGWHPTSTRYAEAQRARPLRELREATGQTSLIEMEKLSSSWTTKTTTGVSRPNDPDCPTPMRHDAKRREERLPLPR